MRLTQATSSTPSSTGSPRSVERRASASAPAAMTMTNGVSWWLTVAAAKSTRSIPSRAMRVADEDGRAACSPGVVGVPITRPTSCRPRLPARRSHDGVRRAAPASHAGRPAGRASRPIGRNHVSRIPMKIRYSRNV